MLGPRNNRRLCLVLNRHQCLPCLPAEAAHSWHPHPWTCSLLSWVFGLVSPPSLVYHPSFVNPPSLQHQAGPGPPSHPGQRLRIPPGSGQRIPRLPGTRVGAAHPPRRSPRYGAGAAHPPPSPKSPPAQRILPRPQLSTSPPSPARDGDRGSASPLSPARRGDRGQRIPRFPAAGRGGSAAACRRAGSGGRELTEQRQEEDQEELRPPERHDGVCGAEPAEPAHSLPGRGRRRPGGGGTALPLPRKPGGGGARIPAPGTAGGTGGVGTDGDGANRSPQTRSIPPVLRLLPRKTSPSGTLSVCEAKFTDGKTRSAFFLSRQKLEISLKATFCSSKPIQGLL